MCCINIHSDWIAHTTLLEIFPGGFADRVNIFLSRQLTISQPITFGIIAPDVTPKITYARAHLKSLTCPELLPVLKTPQMHDQYDLGRLGIISASQALAC